MKPNYEPLACCTSNLISSSPRTIKADAHVLDPGLELITSSLSRRYSEDLRFGCVNAGREFEAIEHEKSFRGSVAESLVSVDEGMIHG